MLRHIENFTHTTCDCPRCCETHGGGKDQNMVGEKYSALEHSKNTNMSHASGARPTEETTIYSTMPFPELSDATKYPTAESLVKNETRCSSQITSCRSHPVGLMFSMPLVGCDLASSLYSLTNGFGSVFCSRLPKVWLTSRCLASSARM